jgi:hypothetical protein
LPVESVLKIQSIAIRATVISKMAMDGRCTAP